ncbi:MAG TPA: hypothetical protein PKK64_13040 [Saprospiraceae bacterium]|nr:hypothetical protein [Leptospiraceae bacterium]HNK25378.1 hypothetical protein [Cyclobacteriaceae bacterium]HNN69408.1 hypothetical protein [Saprospiraceae bacterium]
MPDVNKIIVKVPQAYLDLINQVFEIEKKSTLLKEENSILRNVNKLKDLMQNELFNVKGNETPIGFTYHNPIGENYSDTRTDCEASIAGTKTDDLEIVEVIKPIIFYNYFEDSRPMKNIAQKAVVIVKSRDNS